MHVVFVSNCEQKALKRTRGVLDRYALRVGTRTWITLITQEAPDHVHKALRRKASRYTSVACYRDDAIIGLKLLWIVGNRSMYDSNGNFAISTYRPKKDMPLFLRHAALIARLAGYAHDLGKANKHFVDKLLRSCTCGLEAEQDPIRHEWLSAFLLRKLWFDENVDVNALTDAWKRLESFTANDIKKLPVEDLNSALGASLLTVCTHHSALGGTLSSGPDSTKHVRNDKSGVNCCKLSMDIKGDAEQDAKRWNELISRTNSILKRLREIKRDCFLYWQPVFIAARAALILADHRISSMTFDGTREQNVFYANTKPLTTKEVPSIRRKNKKKTQVRFLDQPLSWHLLRVGEQAAQNIRMIAGKELTVVDEGLREAIRRHRSSGRFSWQDEAVSAVRLEGGKLVFNVAGTGSGKTLANLKMAFAMRDDIRLAVAFNLRTLTEQTFAAFREYVGLCGGNGFERNFACLLGERPVEANEDMQEYEEEIIATDIPVPEWLTNIAKGHDPKNRLAKLIAAPVLVSTMDWIVAAGELGEQARHAKALIRVANSDLILDEVDSYDVKAAVAVMRVVEMAAAFGRNVIVSSATLNSELARGIAAAYHAGRRMYEAVSGEEGWHAVVVHNKIPPEHCKITDTEQADTFYREQMKCIANALGSDDAVRRYCIASVSGYGEYGQTIADAAVMLHGMFKCTPPGLSCKLSIGLVRIANVKPCMEIAEQLRGDGRFIVCAYHAQDLLERRTYKEACLDRILNRKNDGWLDALVSAYPALRMELLSNFVYGHLKRLFPFFGAVHKLHSLDHLGQPG